MSGNVIAVWRESQGEVELVGRIAAGQRGVCFSYDPGYAGRSISCSMPKSNGSLEASPSVTSAFFSALIPEGSAREEFAGMLHAESGEFVPYLERLGDESIGALLFAANDEEPYRRPSYERIGGSLLSDLAARPLETAVAAMGRTRLSLSGAMAKIGLYRSDSGDWYYPLGGAPSTHIVKAADGRRFPLETVNEALCLRVARRCGFPAADCELLDVGEGDPLIAVRRYDRVFGPAPRLVSGMPAPWRVHQEDFCQAASMAGKYEPTDASYLALMSSIARRSCSNSFGEAALLFEYTAFNYLVGNCDNHLKNHAILYSPDWAEREIAPLYDIVSTVEYPEIYREMGVSFGGSRRIDDVTRGMVAETARRCGIPERLAFDSLEETFGALVSAVELEATELAKEGYPRAEALGASIAEGAKERYARIRP